MKTISLAVSESEYEIFRRAAIRMDRSIAQLIREAMRIYREQQLAQGRPLREPSRLDGHVRIGALPHRSDLWDEIHARGIRGTPGARGARGARDTPIRGRAR